MKWKEFLEIEDCDLCPIKEAELCGGGASCYDGSPVDPPCCYFEDDTNLDEWIKEAHDRRRRYEEYQDKLAKEKKAKEEISFAIVINPDRVKVIKQAVEEVIAEKFSKKGGEGDGDL